jgi:rod shape-determining protein MreC
MVSDSQRQQTSAVRGFLSTLISPLEYIAAIPTGFLDWANDSLTSSAALRKQIKELQDEALILRVQAQSMIALEAENAHLRQLLGSIKRERGKRRIAEIMRVDNDPGKHIVTINKGTNDEVYIGQPVLDATGVLGQVVQGSAFTSKVMLITDFNHAIPVKVIRNGFRAIAKGTGLANQLLLEQIPHTTDIKVGDVLVTSGLGLRFPMGFPVAEITSINDDKGRAFVSATAKTTADLTRTGLVVLLWPDFTQDANSEEAQ